MEKNGGDYVKQQEAEKRRPLVDKFNRVVAEAGAEWSRQYAEEQAMRIKACERLAWELETAHEFGAL